MSRIPYIAGKFYRVPCVLARIRSLSQIRWWPVIGPWHEDAEIVGFAHGHYHIDYRFLSDRRLSEITDPYKTFGTVLTRVHSDVRVRRIKCRREYPAYPHRDAQWIREIHEAFAEKKLTNRICPHRGADLSTFAPDADGCITCPLHGLRWDAETGKCRPPNLTFETTGAA